MVAFLYPAYTLASLGLAIWCISLLEYSHSINNSINIILLLLVLAGMTYDNLVVSVGRLINEGTLLELLNRLRFLFHNLFVPLLVVVAVKLACNAGVTWAHYPIICYGCWAIALGLIVFGLLTDFRRLELVPTTFAGSLRYKPKSSSVPVLTISIASLVGVAGFYIWREIQWPWMFVGTLVMFSGNALPTRIFGTLVGCAVDFVFILALLTTALIVH